MRRPALTFTGLVVREKRGYYSICPELDVASQGDTISEAKSMLIDAVTGYLELCFESNLPYLRPVPHEDDPRRVARARVAAVFRIRIDLAVRAHAG